MVWEVIGLVDRRRRSQADDGVMRVSRQDTMAHQVFYHRTGAGMNRIDLDDGGSLGNSGFEDRKVPVVSSKLARSLLPI